MRFIYLFLFVFFFSSLSPADAQTLRTMTPYELGTFRFFDDTVGSVKYQLRWLNVSVNRHTRAANGQGTWTDQNQQSFEKRLCSLANAWIRWRRDFYNGRGSVLPNNYIIYRPNNMADFFKNLFAASRIAKGKSSCSQFSGEEKIDLMIKSAEMWGASEKIKRGSSARLSGGWSNSFSIELSPLPLEVEFVSGSLRIKYSQDVGRFKFSGKTGPSYRGRGYNGLEYITFIDGDNNVHIFYVGGIDFSIELKNAHIEGRGAVLRVYCGSSCHRNFKKLN